MLEAKLLRLGKVPGGGKQENNIGKEGNSGLIITLLIEVHCHDSCFIALLARANYFRKSQLE